MPVHIRYGFSISHSSSYVEVTDSGVNFRLRSGSGIGQLSINVQPLNQGDLTYPFVFLKIQLQSVLLLKSRQLGYMT